MNKKKNIIVCADYLDFRDDIRSMLFEASQVSNLTIYTTTNISGSTESILNQCKVKQIYRRSLLNRIIYRFYDYFSSIPVPDCFWLYKEFELRNAPYSKYYILKKYLNKIKSVLPRFFSYDMLLRSISSPELSENADQYWFVTPINNHEILAKALRENPKNTKIYVYSWDHIYKHTSFTSRAKYMCWNVAAKRELSYFHSVPSKNIKVVGVSPFYYLSHDSTERRCHDPATQITIGFAFACGIYPADVEELQWFINMSQLVSTLYPDIKISARLYPLRNKSIDFSCFNDLKNVEVHNVVSGTFRSFSDHKEKLAWLNGLSMFASFGTTLGLEASLCGVPSFHIRCKPDVSGEASLSAFSNARHLSEEFAKTKSWCCVPSDSYLIDAIEMIRSAEFDINRPDINPILPGQLTNYFLEE